ncbi:thiaminase/transcriptional activator TenA [Natrinema hispanicum]|uniref:Thiaminase/transcriptional activator TenA n=1 Tax=Natrinema hispanicum TaxID=392421 RepID=A0A482Y4D9_9EURY|nr:TenA family protein [Natrinema hispanicum]RZV06403.1 thiaminase/transcriptional activator TenA [Natrinema hispanicum]
MSGDSVADTFEEYAATVGSASGSTGGDEPRFTEWCRARSEPNWTGATEHRFTEELHAGTIDDAAFRRYLVQDYAFLETLVGTFGHALGDAPSMAAKSRLADFLETLTDDEDDYFERSFDALEVAAAERTEPTLQPVTRALQDLLERAAREGGYAETLAVLVPAEWIYRSWAGMGTALPDRDYLSEWVTIHDNPAFDEFVAWLRSELDREGAAASQRRQQRLARLFERTVELEVAFFDAAFEPSDEPEDTVPDGD